MAMKIDDEGSDETEDELPEPPCPLVTAPLEELLAPMQQELYRDAREQFYEWLQTEGKDETRKEGYARSTVKDSLYRMSLVEQWLVRERGLSPTDVSTDAADDYIEHLMERDDVGDSHIRKALDALKRYFRWKGVEWDPENDVRESSSPPKDRKLKPKERRLVKSAALEYGFPDDIDGLDEDERDKYAARIAEHLGKRKSEIEREDWDEMESWKIPSLVYTSADAALRPKEIREFTMGQIMWEDNELRFDASDSTTKDELYWEVPLSDETMMVLRKWRDERAEMEKYDDTDLVWLNRENNPYTSNRLCGLLKTLLRMRGVDPDDTSRKLTWYSIRHSCGSRLVKEADYEVGRQVLRTTSETIRKYNIKDKEELRNAVENLE